jgi:hypothetical protein
VLTHVALLKSALQAWCGQRMRLVQTQVLI